MKNHITKKTIAIISLALLILITVGTTLALVFSNTDSVENTFKPSKVSCAVVETLVNGDNSTTTETSAGTVSNFTSKSNVQIKNTGDTDAFIRVAVVVNWMSADGKVWAQKPIIGTDYQIAFNLKDKNGVDIWEQGADEYWYCKKEVAPTKTTDILITEAKQLKPAPEGYYLSIEIVASAIQSTPDTTVEEQWKNNKVVIDANNGTLDVSNVTSTEASE